MRAPEQRSGVERIATERARQTEKGYDSAHDAQHTNGELAQAAACYLWAARHPYADMMEVLPLTPMRDEGVPEWPFEPEAWQPAASPTRNLEKAGALIAAELDRPGGMR